MTLLDCGHAPTPDAGIGTGYATTPDGRRICYGCADSREAERMARGETIVAYLSTDARTVTTWTGGVLARVTSAHTSARARKTYVRAVDVDARSWHGSGPAESGTYVTLRRSVASCPPA
jgi:hypothetical protein